MGTEKRSLVLPVLIAFLMLASTFVIFTGVSDAVQPASLRAAGDEGRVLYVYGENKTMAAEWREFLMDNGYYVDLLPSRGLMGAQYANYNFVIIANDSVGVAKEYLQDMYRSHVPVLGLGRGGVLAAQSLGLIGTGYYSSLSDATVSVDTHRLCIYSTPHTISGVPGTVTIYSTSAQRVYLMRRADRVENQTLYIANASGNSGYSPIAQVNSFMLYGFVQGPRSLTVAGDALLRNIIFYVDSHHTYNLGIPRVSSRIVLDGKYSYLFEWFPYRHIMLDTSGINYTAFYEDEEYLYVMMHMANTSNVDYLSVVFDSNNTRISGSTDEHVFYVILSESQGGVKYRESTASGNWGSFLTPDGVNVTAKWSFDSKYAMAEVRIAKSYMGVRRGSDSIMGFGIQYTGAINYPSTFKYTDSSTYVTMYSQNNWVGQYEFVRTVPGYAPNVDGVVNGLEWYGSSSYYIQDINGYPVSLMSLYDGDAVYFGGYIDNYTGGYSAFYLYFDPDSNGGTSPQTDDFRLLIDKSPNGTVDVGESYGTGTSWGSTQKLTDAQIATTTDGDRLYFEMRINYSKLGLQRGEFKEVPMRVRSYTHGAGYTVPYLSSYTAPDEWHLFLFPSSRWGVGYGTFDAHNGTAVTLDGNVGYGEWNDAFMITHRVANSGKTMYIYIKTDSLNSTLNMMIFYPNPVDSSSTALYIGFDVNNDRDGALREDDFAIGVTYRGTAKEWNGTSHGTWNTAVPHGWAYAMNNTTHSWTVELSINYSKLGIMHGVPGELGIVFAMVDSGVAMSYIPLGGTMENTTTWDVLTSSDNWGSGSEVPELSVVAVMAIVVVAAVALRRKR